MDRQWRERDVDVRAPKPITCAQCGAVVVPVSITGTFARPITHTCAVPLTRTFCGSLSA